MHLNPYGEYAVRLAQSLANCWPETRDEVIARTREFGMTMHFSPRRNDYVDSRQVIDEWLQIVSEEDPVQRANLLNRQMAAVAAYPRLTDHNGEGWHLHYRGDENDLSTVLRAVISVGTALHLTTRGMNRLGRCAAPPCEHVIVDISRNGTQRYCSPRCASREAVRRHRKKELDKSIRRATRQ